MSFFWFFLGLAVTIFALRHIQKFGKEEKK